MHTILTPRPPGGGLVRTPRAGRVTAQSPHFSPRRPRSRSGLRDVCHGRHDLADASPGTPTERTPDEHVR